MEPGELRPGDRLHLGGRVELHRAGAERDHGPVEREVPVRQPAQVAQHRGLGAVRVEDRVGQEVAEVRRSVGGHARRAAAASSRRARRADLEGGQDRCQVVGLGRLVAGDADVSASTRRRLMPRSRAAATTSSARPGTLAWTVSKKVVVRRPRRRRSRKPVGQHGGVAVDAPGDAASGPSGPW